MTPNPNTNPDEVIFKTGTTVSDAPSWFDSLRRQIRELREERKHPRQKVEITAQRDPSALNNLVEMPSPVLSLFSEQIANDRPLLLHYDGRTFFPSVKFYAAENFGGKYRTEADYLSPA